MTNQKLFFIKKSLALICGATCALTFNPVDAKNFPVSGRCELGSTCIIPSEKGGQTYFNISPSTGNNYICKIKAKSESVKFTITSGKDFSILKGDGLYNANPEVDVTIIGRFSNPENPDSKGQIKFTHIPTSGEGEITCTKQ